MNDAVFEKITDNLRKYRNIKLATAEGRRNQLVSEQQNIIQTTHTTYTTNFFSEHLLAIEIKKTQIFINKPIYLGLSIIEIGKIVMHEFWYNYVKPECGEKSKFCYLDTVNFVATYKQRTLTQTVQKMLKEDLILQILNQIDYYLK